MYTPKLGRFCICLVYGVAVDLHVLQHCPLFRTLLQSLTVYNLDEHV